MIRRQSQQPGAAGGGPKHRGESAAVNPPLFRWLSDLTGGPDLVNGADVDDAKRAAVDAGRRLAEEGIHDLRSLALSASQPLVLDDL